MLDALEQDRQRTYQERQQKFDADLRQSEQALADARSEWEKALAEAAARAAEAESRVAPERVRQTDFDLSGLDNLIDTTRRKIDIVGTFNPMAAANLGADSLGERTARASEQVATNTRRLLQEAQHGGLMFG